MTGEIVDGKELQCQFFQSRLSFQNSKVHFTVFYFLHLFMIEFKDETGNLPSDDDFKLYKYLYGKKTGTLSSKETEQMKIDLRIGRQSAQRKLLQI
ncbi:MAG: hypothetical protein IPK31_14450 [Chitinophagaceae bacterium]|nr:hypothetical protein [Chitinophagaceae bacterium]